MVYPTIKATVRNGQIHLLDDIQLPEDAVLLVTIMETESQVSLSLGERITGSLQDILEGRFTRVETPEELAHHMDQVLNED